MKKLMIAAAIVCAAALSHGAALQWGIGEIPKADGAIVPATTYWISATSMDDFNAAADKWAYVGTVADTDKAAGGITSGRSGYSAKGEFGDFDPGDPVQGFIVAFDAGHDNYVASKFIDFLTPGAGGANFSGTFSADTAGWKSNTSAAPEPTSGLLLLLGVAGLALKRKRA